MNDAAKDAIVCVGAHFCDGDISSWRSCAVDVVIGGKWPLYAIRDS
jgi:hypothetical protein